jgi:hypothetical protein
VLVQGSEAAAKVMASMVGAGLKGEVEVWGVAVLGVAWGAGYRVEGGVREGVVEGGVREGVVEDAVAASEVAAEAAALEGVALEAALEVG